MNTFGDKFRFTSFGESHGIAVGGIVDGCPAGMELDTAFIQQELDRRKPGQSKLTTTRKEEDKVHFLSGLFEGKTTGTPIAFVIYNTNQYSHDYDHLKEIFRPSHADFTYQQKYGIRDHRGGGRSSARETAGRVVAGAIAKQVLKQRGIDIVAYVSQVGGVALSNDYTRYDLSQARTNPICCPDPEKAKEMEALVLSVKRECDSIGGVISCVVKGLPTGLGDPIFGKVQAKLASAIMSINAVKGFEYGSGFAGVERRGSELNDAFCMREGKVSTVTNHSGGVQGGITNGQDLYFRVAFKPTATISQPQRSVTTMGEETMLVAKGRHDPCVLPRAVPIVEAMAALAIVNLL